MKKILSIAASSLLLLTGCNMDINDNPNYPSTSNVTTDLVFPSAENAIADCVGDEMLNYAGFFAQYFDQAPTANQYNDEAELNINESSDLFNRCYRSLYAGALEDLQDILDRDTNPADIFICKVLRAYSFQLVVDNLGYAPYTEALKGSAVTSPRWDDGKTVYEGVLKEMDDAEAALTDQSVISLTDPMLYKDLDEWKGFANALRLRMYLRLIDSSETPDENYVSKVKALVADNDFFEGSVAWDVYQNAEGQYNPWYDSYFSLGTKNHCAAYPIISYQLETSDPRISYLFTPRSKDNTYVGQFPGAKTVEPTWLGLSTSEYQENMVSMTDYSVVTDLPIFLFTQAELQFLIAEVELRFNNNDNNAKIAYQSGIAADFQSKGYDPTEFFEQDGVAWTADKATNLKQIYMQKWVALFMRDHMEAWTEARRTDVPALSSAKGKDICKDPTIYTPGDFIEPAVNYVQAGGLALSVPYPSTARTLNTNTPTARKLSDRVFWDRK